MLTQSSAQQIANGSAHDAASLKPENHWSASALCPADRRILNFLNDYLKNVPDFKPLSWPSPFLVLDRPGLARAWSLPKDEDYFSSDIVNSYRLKQGVLHNPRNDRRTTQGVFHVVRGGLPIADDKIEVGQDVFARLLRVALQPPDELLTLPYGSRSQTPLRAIVSLLLRPMISPEIKNVMPHKSLEIRFFAPGNLVGNLDFVESIFGNGGDPFIDKNDAARDIDHWSGHTGCVILAPHLTRLTKKELGLPRMSEATERQKRDGQCYQNDSELYNQGEAFKITCRDKRGVIVTLIADNYFGYCKKEVKTQMSFAANLAGLCEEEHSGGAIAFASYDLAEEFTLEAGYANSSNTFRDTIRLLGPTIEVKDGYAVDKKYSNVIYVPEDARFNLDDASVTFARNGERKKIKLLVDHSYIYPSGYRMRMKKQTGGNAWHLVGTVASGVHCHKPCTVSGGGKSEISKSIVDAMIQGPVFAANLSEDAKLVDDIIYRDYSDCLKPEFASERARRSFLSPERSLGSAIKLLTVSNEYTDAYNAWLKTIPGYIKEIVFTVKRFYHPDWGRDWRKYFSVDIVNGELGHELKFNNRKLTANYLRVGKQSDGSWRIFRVRPDFAAAEKIQTADDITVSTVIAASKLAGLGNETPNPSVKLINNAESHLFQRPDDAVIIGYDKQAEADIASDGTFVSNFEPLDKKQVQELVDDAIHFDLYTPPMKNLLSDFLAGHEHPSYVVASSHPRLIQGKRTKNPRYLQRRPDLSDPRKKYMADVCGRLYRSVAHDEPLHWPVNAVLPGRRNNPPDHDANVPALAVYNPIHYQELPELFMDFICSLTGKSPSTTGYGSEGALTKGPFNALWPIVDLNNCLTSFIITGYQGFSSAAGVVGPHYQVDHDISLLIPEIWCRMKSYEQNPEYMIRHGFLEKVEDFIHEGRVVRSSLLGYRITARFANTFLGRIFSNPNIVFTEEMLKPEKQSLSDFVEGIDNILITQKHVARHYFNDGSVRAACPPLQALIHIMLDGHFEGKGIDHPDIRLLFDRERTLKSDWYRARLLAQQERDVALWTRHSQYAEDPALKQKAVERLGYLRSKAYAQFLEGTIGADPLIGQLE